MWKYHFLKDDWNLSPHFVIFVHKRPKVIHFVSSLHGKIRYHEILEMFIVTWSKVLKLVLIDLQVSRSMPLIFVEVRVQWRFDMQGFKLVLVQGLEPSISETLQGPRPYFTLTFSVDLHFLLLDLSFTMSRIYLSWK